MATVVTFNGVSYSVPAVNEEDWESLSNYLVALQNATVSGGPKVSNIRVSTSATTAVATTDYAVLINYAGAATVNLPAGATGQVFVIADVSGAAATNNITINRNGANTILGGTSLVLDRNNEVVILAFSGGNWYRVGDALPNAVTAPASTTANGLMAFTGTDGKFASDLGVGTADDVLVTNGTTPSFAKIVNANVDGAAAIAYSKLDLTGQLVNADINASAAIAYSKLALTGSIVNADINASAAIAYSKLALTGSIVNADIDASADIARTKIASGSANHVVVNDGAGALSSVATLPVSQGGTGLNALGSALQVLRVDSGGTALEFATLAAGSGDVVGPSSSVTNGIVQFASTTGKALKDLGVGSANQVLLTDGTGPSFGAITNAYIDASAAISYSKLDLGNSIVNSDISSGANIALSKLNSLTSNRAVETNGAGHLRASTVTATELGYVSGVTSSIQTQLNSKLSAAITSLNSQTGASQTFVAGTLGSDFAISSSGNVHTFNLPNAGPSSRGVVDAGNQTFAGAKTFSDALSVSAASNQIALSSGVNRLTLNSGTSAAARTYTVPAVGTTGTFAMLQGAQTFSALKTFSAGLAISGGAAANNTLWTNSNVLRQRGGSSGWAVDNTSGNAILSATDAGAVTLGQIHNIGAGNITSGTYTPAMTAVTNINTIGTVAEGRYSRVGNVVTVSFAFSGQIATAAAPTVTRFKVTLPIATSFGSLSDAHGTVTIWRASAPIGTSSGLVISRTSDDEIDIYYQAFTTNAVEGYVIFQYEVI